MVVTAILNVVSAVGIVTSDAIAFGSQKSRHAVSVVVTMIVGVTSARRHGVSSVASISAQSKPAIAFAELNALVQSQDLKGAVQGRIFASGLINR